MGQLDACYLSSLDFSHLKRAVQAEGPERASTAQDFQFRKRFFLSRHALQIHRPLVRVREASSLLMRIAPATGNEGDLGPNTCPRRAKVQGALGSNSGGPLEHDSENGADQTDPDVPRLLADHIRQSTAEPDGAGIRS